MSLQSREFVKPKFFQEKTPEVITSGAVFSNC